MSDPTADPTTDPTSSAHYRLALEGSVQEAAGLLTPEATRTSPPLWEVVASRFTWAELGPWAPDGFATVLAGATRVLLGEDLSQEERLDADGIGSPFVLQPWEAPCWQGVLSLPSYSPNGFARIGAPGALGDISVLDLPDPGEPLPPGPAESGLAKVVHGWDDATAVGVRGTALHAVATVRGTSTGTVHGGWLEPADAFATVIDRAAGGIFAVPYQGMAVGRAVAWRAVAGLARTAAATSATSAQSDGDDGGDAEQDGDAARATSLDRGAYDCAEVGDFMARSRWFQWLEPDRENALHLAVEDPRSGLSWALDARTLSS